MKLFLVHLWREWREHRRSLYLLVGCLTLAVFMLSQQLSENAQRDPTTVRWTALLVIATVTISVGSDLFASEKQRGTDAFLRRLPGGLGSAFCAKLVFFCLLITGATLFGLGLGTAAFVSNAGSLPQGVLSFAHPWEFTIYVAGLLWVFAISTWVKSAALTLPSAALFLAGISWPGWLLLFKGGLFSVTGLLLAIFLALAISGALVCSWTSFVRAGRRGHSHRRATIQGLVLACLFFVPSWAWAGKRYLVLQETQLTFKWAQLGEEGRHAFVTLRREPTHGSGKFKQKSRIGHAAIVDMLTAQVKWVGGRNSSKWNTFAPRPGTSILAEERGYPVFELYSVPLSLSHLTSVPEPTLFDGLTGEVLEGDVHERIEAFERGWTWPQEFNTAATLFDVQHAGAGYIAWWRGEEGSTVKLYWDPATNRISDLAAFSNENVREVLVGPSRWLVRSADTHWMWFDPESNEAEAAQEIEPSDSVKRCFDDGSVLLKRRGKLLRLDTGSGELIELVTRSSTGEGLILQKLHVPGRPPISSQTKTAITCLTTADAPGSPAWGVAVLDPLTNTIQVPVPRLGHVLVQGKGFALVLDGPQRLLRLDLKTLETRLVLDLNEADPVPRE